MTALRLYTGPLSMFGMKTEIALAEKGLTFERIEVAFDNARGYVPKHPDVVRANPKQQVPVLKDGGLTLFDSTQIFEYLEDAYPTPPLWPRAPADRARARQLEHRADEVYFPPVARLMGLQDKLNSPEAQSAMAGVDGEAQHMETVLGAHDFIAGAYSYADIALFMANVFAERMSAALTPTTPRLLDWRRRVGNRAAVRPVVSRLVTYLRANGRYIPAYLNDIATSTKDIT